MLIVVVAALLGIWRYRTAEYFKWVGILFVWMLAGSLLFAGGGTLEDPTGDGLIAHQIRIATNNGPGMGMFAAVFLLVYWGGAIFFITRLVRAARQAKAAEEASYDDPDGIDPDESTARQALETLILLVFAALWIWYFFWRPLQPQDTTSAAAAYNEQLRKAAQAPLSVEQQLKGAAAEVNAQTPQDLGGMTLERATAAGYTLTYHYTTNETATPAEIERFVLAGVLPKVCDGPLRKHMKELGVSYGYAYLPKNLNEEVGVVITEEMCAQTEK